MKVGFLILRYTNCNSLHLLPMTSTFIPNVMFRNMELAPRKPSHHILGFPDPKGPNFRFNKNLGLFGQPVFFRFFWGGKMMGREKEGGVYRCRRVGTTLRMKKGCLPKKQWQPRGSQDSFFCFQSLGWRTHVFFKKITWILTHRSLKFSSNSSLRIQVSLPDRIGLRVPIPVENCRI